LSFCGLGIGYMLLQTIYRALAFWSAALLAGVLLVGLFVLPILIYFGKDLPDYKQLTNYDPPTISRIYTSTGELMSELAIERRIYRKIDEIPQVVINAFIAAEDQNYYNHPGIDVFSIIRAGIQNLANIGTERNPVGGSTITQQVVKNFLLTNERSLSRKIKEAILAYRINNVYSKDKILELYLNQIYLGNSAYGVTSAALNYFNKDLKYVTIEEAALIAALPKAPSILDPTKNQERAKARRDWVIDRMREEGYISSDEVKKAQDTPIKLSTRFESSVLDNGYYTESVRLELIERYGFDYVYQEGISAFTNLDKDMQKYADAALRNGLLAYDKKHGYRGAIKTITVKGGDWKSQLNQIETPEAAVSWRLAVVLENAAGALSVGFKDGAKGLIPATNTKWARPVGNDNIKVGDVILVGTDKDKAYTLEQLPRVNGGLVAIQPKTGKVLAMSGGYSFKGSKYNRALQALRQPGSTFKPFVYLAALEKGYGPTSIVKDEPISISQGPDKPAWTPKNYEGKFLGEITLRQALEKSRNLATVYLITKVGPKKVAEVANRLGVYDQQPPAYYAMALGSVETTLMHITSAYASFASGGMLVKGKLIDRVQDRKGNLIYKSDDRECDGCGGADGAGLKDDPDLTYSAQFVVNPVENYQIVSMLKGVVERGTAAKARSLNRILAGKTGTSNDSLDTWFIGFSPDLVVGVFVGYDTPKSLGAKETGASVALPIFIDFMAHALKDMPNKDFEVPEGVELREVDYNSGTAGGGLFSNSRVMEPVKRGAKFIDDASEYSSSSSEDSEGVSDSSSEHNFGSGGIY